MPIYETCPEPGEGSLAEILCRTCRLVTWISGRSLLPLMILTFDEFNMTTSKHKMDRVVAIAIAGLILAIYGVCCGSVLRDLLPARMPDPIPDTDIVYMGGGKLGFVNADGSGLTKIRFNVPYNDFHSSWGSPLVAGDEALIVTVTNYPGAIGKIFVAPPGEVAADCEWYGIPRLAADGRHILVDTGETIERYLPEDCGTGNPPEKIYGGVFDILSPDVLSPHEEYSAEVYRGEYGAYTEPSIILHNLRTGEKRIVGEGNFPVWSRDGQWLAYTGADGIYIIQNSPGAQPRRLVAFAEPSSGVYREYDYVPIASWSPDGKWLVYHEYHSKPVDPHAEFGAQHYSIFKVNVETGETIKLVDGGFSPFWRWPVEEP